VTGRSINRRRHERFHLPPMYTAVTVQILGESPMELEGHCYDISEGGVQFELDDVLPTGTAIELKIALPTHGGDPIDHEVKVVGNVVWNDQSEPGPVRMAAVFSRFGAHADKERLFRHISGGHLTRAA
jgi:hypothetical protein